MADAFIETALATAPQEIQLLAPLPADMRCALERLKLHERTEAEAEAEEGVAGNAGWDYLHQTTRRRT